MLKNSVFDGQPFSKVSAVLKLISPKVVLKSFQRSNWCSEICSSRRKPRKDREGLGYRPQPPTQRALPTYPWPPSPWHTARPLSQHFLKIIIILAALGLRCWVWTLLCSVWSLCCSTGFLWLWCVGFLVVMCGLSCPAGCRILVPRPGAKPPTSPALQGGFLTTGPPGKSLNTFLCFKQVKVFSPHPQLATGFLTGMMSKSSCLVHSGC